MEIQIFADFICPFCYAGKKKLMDAVEAVDSSIKVEMMSYELAPGVEDNNNLKMSDVHDSAGENTAVKDMVEDAGLSINSEDLKFSNSLKAHTLLQYAKEKGIAPELSAAIYHAYFVEGAYLNKIEHLVEAASKAGIEEETVREVIASDKYIEGVHADQKIAKELDVRSVPTIFINGKETDLEGKDSLEVYKETIKEEM